VFGDDFGGEPQPDAGTLQFFCRKEGIEDLRESLARYAAARIAE
jgi:hypothetical protein